MGIVVPMHPRPNLSLAIIYGIHANQTIRRYVGSDWLTTLIEDGIRRDREELDLMYFLIETCPDALLCEMLDV